MKKVFFLSVLLVMGLNCNGFGGSVPLSFSNAPMSNGNETPPYWGEIMKFVPLGELLSKEVGYSISPDDEKKIVTLLNSMADDPYFEGDASDFTAKIIKVYEANPSIFKAKVQLNIMTRDGKTISLTDIFVRDIKGKSWYILN